MHERSETFRIEDLVGLLQGLNFVFPPLHSLFIANMHLEAHRLEVLLVIQCLVELLLCGLEVLQEIT